MEQNKKELLMEQVDKINEVISTLSEKPTSRGRKIRLIVVEKSELQRSEKSTQLILNIIILILVIRTGIILILSIFQILLNSSQWI